MTNTTKEVKPGSLRGIEDCRVNEIGIPDFAECLQEGPSTCSHALPFGYCFLCKHPRLDEIIENSRKAQSVAEVLK